MEKNFFDQTVENDIRTYDNIREIITGQRDAYAANCLIDYNCSKDYYSTIVIDLSKQKALDSDPKAIQEISFIGNLEQDGNTTTFFITEEAKQTILDFSKETVQVSWIYFALIEY